MDQERPRARDAGEPRLAMEVAGRRFLVSAETFFQGNRHLAGELSAHVGRTGGLPPGEALDAFGGVGFFAAALLEAGHSVTSVEGSPPAARDAAKTRPGWPDADRWRIVPSSVEGYLSSSTRRFDQGVVDPPVGARPIAAALRRPARETLVRYPQPATLARVPALIFEGSPRDARFYDSFP